MNKSETQFKKMTETPIPKLIVGLSIPTILSMLITNVYNLVDTAFVGTLGNSASGAVGIVFGFMAILQAIGFLFGQGSGSIISRRLGQGETEEASKVASTAFFGAMGLAFIAEIICFAFLDDIVVALGSTPTIAPYAKTYIIYILISAPFLVTSFTLNNILRYEGKAMFGMVGMMSGAILNIFGDALFIFGLNMGIAGAGLSTAIAQIVSFTILLSMFLRGKTASKISLKNICFTTVMLFDITSTGFPSLLRQGLNSFTTVLLNHQAAVYGDEAVAAMSIVSRIIFFTFSIAIGIGQGFQPVSGFNFGAKRYDRVRKAYWFTFALAEGILFVLSVVTLVLSPELIQIFRNDTKVIEIGTRALQLQAAAQLALPFCMVTEMLFQSTGRRMFATVLSGMRSGLLFIPCLLVLANLRGLAGIQEAQPLSCLLSVLPTIVCANIFWSKYKPGSEQVNEEN